jgi:hypothetical protein
MTLLSRPGFDLIDRWKEAAESLCEQAGTHVSFCEITRLNGSTVELISLAVHADAALSPHMPPVWRPIFFHWREHWVCDQRIYEQFALDGLSRCVREELRSAKLVDQCLPSRDRHEH